MKRASYQNTRYSQEYQYSDGEDQVQPGYRYKSMEKKSRHVPGSVPNSENEFSRYERYESHQTSILEKDQSSIGRKVIFYKNSDSLFQGIPIAISRKKFPEFPSLLAELNSKIPLPNGVRFIFRREDGKKIESLEEIQGGEEYVVSSKSKFDRRTNYGAPSPTKPRSNMQRSQGPSREHLNNRSNFQPAYGSPKQNQQQMPPVNNKPLKFTIINNTYRSLRDKMIVNPNTEQSFEELLANMGEVVSIMDGPPTAIFRAKSPYTEITCFSALKTELTHKNEDKRCDEFFICDDKGPPKEILQKAGRGNARSSNAAPSDMSYDDVMEEERVMEYENYPDRRQKPKERGRAPPQAERHRQQKPPQRDPRYEQMNGHHGNKNGSLNGTKENAQRSIDDRKFTKPPQTHREQEPPPKRYTSPPRNINKQNDQRHQRQPEKPNVRQSQNTPRRPAPVVDQREKPHHKEEQTRERRGPHDNRNAHHTGARKEKPQNKMADEIEQNSESGRSYHDDDNGYVENGANMEDDRENYRDDRNGREEEEMDYDDRENGDENDDDYDDDSDGPGEPRAARKGPRMETPEF